MKKIYMTLVAAMFAVCASAQIYVGGNVGISSVDSDWSDDSETYYKLLPEVGYKFNDDWAAGVMFGWSKGQAELSGLSDAVHTFEINPYARYTFFHSKVVNLFCDGGFGYKHYNGAANQWSIGLKPGIEVKLNKFSLVAHVGFLGWEQVKGIDNGPKASEWGVNLDGNNITFGVYYNF